MWDGGCCKNEPFSGSGGVADDGIFEDFRVAGKVAAVKTNPIGGDDMAMDDGICEIFGCREAVAVKTNPICVSAGVTDQPERAAPRQTSYLWGAMLVSQLEMRQAAIACRVREPLKFLLNRSE